ncbi:hypothetical protein Ddc_00489 [Ditylenchus destructor]|nr:hypothetical protein Ddc_00489 [Ditylenchus destructor]
MSYSPSVATATVHYWSDYYSSVRPSCSTGLSSKSPSVGFLFTNVDKYDQKYEQSSRDVDRWRPRRKCVTTLSPLSSNRLQESFLIQLSEFYCGHGVKKEPQY